MKIYLLPVLSILLSVACRNDDDTPLPTAAETCVEAGAKFDDFFQPLYTIQFPLADKIVAHPTDPNRFVYRYFIENGPPSIRHYDRSTGEATTLVQSGVAGKIDWHENGWLLFSTHTLGTGGINVFRMRSDGSGLTQLTFTNNNGYAVWNAAGDRFAYWSGIGSSARRIVADFDGNTISNISVGVTVPFLQWGTDSTLYGMNYNGLYGQNAYTGIIDTLTSVSNNGESGGYRRIGDDIYFGDAEGLNRFHIPSGEKEIIRYTCASMHYSIESSRTSTNTPLVLYGYEYVPADTLPVPDRPDLITGELYHRIYTMSTDGHTLEEVVIPEE